MRIDRVKLVTEMAKRNITQKRLAEISGISKTSISNVRNGKNCSDSTGFKIADALNVPIEKILEK